MILHKIKVSQGYFEKFLWMFWKCENWAKWAGVYHPNQISNGIFHSRLSVQVPKHHFLFKKSLYESTHLPEFDLENLLNWKFGGHFRPNEAAEVKKISTPTNSFMSRYYHVKLVSKLKNGFPHLVVAIVFLLLNEENWENGTSLPEFSVSTQSMDFSEFSIDFWNF